jgi:ABC-2 type transport system permease protein
MSRNRKPQKLLVQLVDLTLIELTNWRWTWRSMLLLGMITPLCSMLAIKFLLAEMRPEDVAYVYCGNVLLSLMFENQNRVGGHFVFMRFHGTLDYFGSLPIRKLTLILGMALAFLLLSLPSVVVVSLVGAWVLDVRLELHPVILLVIPLCAISMSGVGALVGSLARTSAEATSLGFFFTLLLSGLGAVIIPAGRLPNWLVKLGVLSPATYASSALRQAMLGHPTTIVTDLAVLVAFGAATLWLAGRTIGWREQ